MKKGTGATKIKQVQLMEEEGGVILVISGLIVPESER